MVKFNDIMKLCLVSVRFNNIICNDRRFWKDLVKRDYGKINFVRDAEGIPLDNPESYSEVIDWKKFYVNFNDVWMYGAGLLDPITRSLASKPIHLENIHGLTMAFGGSNFAVVDTNHNVWVWGKTDEIGLGYKGEVNTPTLLPGGIKAKDVSIGNTNGLVLIDTNDNLWITNFRNNNNTSYRPISINVKDDRGRSVDPYARRSNLNSQLR